MGDGVREGDESDVCGVCVCVCVVVVGGVFVLNYGRVDGRGWMCAKMGRGLISIQNA